MATPATRRWMSNCPSKRIIRIWRLSSALCPPRCGMWSFTEFLGGRPEYQLANFGEAHQFLKTVKQFTTARFEELVVGFAGGSLKHQIEGQFSVMVLEESQVKITGECDFPLNVPTVLKPMSSLGLSNKGNGPVVISCSGPCFLFL